MLRGQLFCFIFMQQTLYLQKLAVISPKSCGRSVGIVRSRTQATEFLMQQRVFSRSHHMGHKVQTLMFDTGDKTTAA
jgi:hypothetical protein